jgi:hypothetical protein
MALALIESNPRKKRKRPNEDDDHLLHLPPRFGCLSALLSQYFLPNSPSAEKAACVAFFCVTSLY